MATEQQGTIFVRDASGQITASIVVDAILTEQHTLENELTEHPVEEGSPITDHNRPKPEVVQLDCLISNTPLSTTQQRRIVQSGSIRLVTTALAPPPEGSPGYAENAYAQLKTWRLAGTLVTVVTTLEQYDNVGIQMISLPRNSTTVDALRFTLSIKRVRVVQNKLTRVTVSKDKRVGAKVKQGNQVPQQPQQESTALFDLADKASNSNNDTLAGLGKALLKR